MLGSEAAVIETESPSQPSPVVIQTTWISFTSGGRSATIISGAFMPILPSVVREKASSSVHDSPSDSSY
jgi:hypothetical protein